MKRNTNQDVASKSLSDLESLVDQIPSITDAGNQRLHSQGGMSDDGMNDKLDHHQGYLGFNTPSMTNYSPPLSTSGVYPGGHLYPGDNYGIYNGRQDVVQQQQHHQQHSKSYTVENLASSNYTPSINQSGNYGNIIPGPHYPVPTMGASNGYLFGGLESSLMQRTYGMSGMSGMHPSLGHMANPYPYNATYSSSFDSYSTPPGGIHTPSPNYPGGYPSANNSPNGHSTSPSYLQSHHRPPVDLAYDGV